MIVTPYANVREGQQVIVALVGSTVNDKEVKKVKVHGEWSEGVICGPAEMGLEGDALSCIVLDGLYKSGQPAPLKPRLFKGELAIVEAEEGDAEEEDEDEPDEEEDGKHDKGNIYKKHHVDKKHKESGKEKAARLKKQEEGDDEDKEKAARLKKQEEGDD